MTLLSRLPARGGVLVMGGLLAVCLHALLFTSLPSRRNGSRGTSVWRSQDNTPQLLQFSSQPPPPLSFGVSPLPKSQLLPPPPELQSGRTRQDTTQPRSMAAQGSRKASSSTRITAPSSRERQGKGVDKGQWLHPGGSDHPEASVRDSQADWAAAVEQLRGVPRQGPTAGPVPASVDTVTGKDGLPGVRMAMEAPLQRVYQTLWGRSRLLAPQPLPRESTAASADVEVRQASLRDVRAAAVAIRHGDVVVLPDKVLLFWMQGENLFILQSTRPSPPS